MFKALSARIVSLLAQMLDPSLQTAQALEEWCSVIVPPVTKAPHKNRSMAIQGHQPHVSCLLNP